MIRCVRVVGLMFSLLDNFVEWGFGGGVVQERAFVILTYFQDACHARQRVACIREVGTHEVPAAN